MEVEELLQSKNIEYNRTASDFVIKCLNPEHDDSNPSLSIDRVTGVFNCFSCGFSGNIFRHYKVKVDYVDIKRAKLFRAIEKCRSETVGLTMPKGFEPVIDDFRGISYKTLMHFEAFRHHSFPDMIVFPIKDIRGKIIVFLGRHYLKEVKKGKYKFEPRKISPPLYPAPVKPILGRVIVVEGIFDMLNLYDKGLQNVIVSFGINSINNENLENLKVMGISGIDIIFDGDEAGQRGAAKFQERCEEQGFSVRNIEIHEGTDPGDMDQERVRRLKKYLYDI